MPISLPSTVSPTLLLQISLCRCHKHQKCVLCLAKWKGYLLLWDREKEDETWLQSPEMYMHSMCIFFS